MAARIPAAPRRAACTSRRTLAARRNTIPPSTRQPPHQARNSQPRTSTEGSGCGTATAASAASDRIEETSDRGDTQSGHGHQNALTSNGSDIRPAVPPRALSIAGASGRWRQSSRCRSQEGSDYWCEERMPVTSVRMRHLSRHRSLVDVIFQPTHRRTPFHYAYYTLCHLEYIPSLARGRGESPRVPLTVGHIRLWISITGERREAWSASTNE